MSRGVYPRATRVQRTQSMSQFAKPSLSGSVQCRRRIVKWVALIAAIPTMLLSAYVFAWLLFTGWAARGGALPPGRYTTFTISAQEGVIASHVAFEPIHRYITAERPGSKLLSGLQEEVLQRAFPAPVPQPRPDLPVMEDMDRLLMDIPQ